MSRFSSPIRRRSPLGGRVWTGCLSGWLLVTAAWAQILPVARLSTVYPAGATRGVETMVTVTGTDLEEPQALLFSDARVTAKVTPTNSAAFLVTVPSDVPPGLIDVRWAGRFGVSNPRAFVVNPGPELLSVATNTLPKVAQELPVETVVNGRMAANASAWYRVSLEAGKRYVARVESRELDSRLEPVLEWRELGGRPLAESRHGFLEFVPGTNGTWFVGVRDNTYRGGEDFVYRLTVTSGPHVDFAVPLVLRDGETNRVTLWGRNLPGSRLSARLGVDRRPLEEVEVEIVPPTPDARPVATEGFRRPVGTSVAAESWVWRWTPTNGISNPVLFSLSPLPVVASVTNGLTEVGPPVEFCGFFPAPGELSGVTFAAKKGEVWWLELSSERLGFVADPRAVVERVRSTPGEKGETQFADVLELGDLDTNLGGSDFNTVTRDAAARLEAPQDGIYRIRVQDAFNLGLASVRWPYRLTLRRETPDVSLVALPLQSPRLNDNDRSAQTQPLFLRRGETQLIRVVAFRRDGFGGEIELAATNLPAGVTVPAMRIPAGQNVAFVPVTASEDAAVPAEGVAWTMLGRGPTGSPRPVTWATVSWLIPDWNERAVAARPVREGRLAVSRVESAPVTVRTTTNRLDVPATGKWMVPVDVVRRGDFPAAIALKPAGRPEWDKSKPATVPEKATNAVLEFEVAELKLPPGEHTVWLQGTIAGKYRNNPEALTEAEAELKAAEQALAAASAGEKEALEKRKKAAEERRKAAEERAKPRDVNLPLVSVPFTVNVLPAPAEPAKTPPK